MNLGPFRMSRRIGWPLAAGAAAAMLAFAAGWFGHGGERGTTASYAATRRLVVEAQVAETMRPYLFLAGDSYAELYGDGSLGCGRPVVNGGVSGARSADYLAFLADLAMARRPAAVLLLIGTNDLFRKRDPGSAKAVARFRSDAAALVATLGRERTPVVVSAVPPIPESGAGLFDTAAFERYSGILAEACKAAGEGCSFADPFASVRSDAFWKSRPGTTRDGLHVAALGTAYRSLEPLLCR